MGKTVRYASSEKKQYRKPKRNGARKGEVRPKALPPNEYDDLTIAANEENWHLSHPDIEAFDPKLKRNKSKWRSEKNKIKRKSESNWQEFDDDEFFEEYY